MAVLLAVLLLFTGLAVDSGRAYVVKAQLTKAVDGAALAAARNLNSGNPRQRSDRASSRRTFRPAILGTSLGRPIRPPTRTSSRSTTDPATGVNIVTVDGVGDAADDVHEAGATSTQVTVNAHRRSDAAHGRPVAGARRVELDRIAVADGARRGADLHQLVRRRARSRRAADLRQRRVGARPDAGRPRLRQDEGHGTTCRPRCPAAAPTWSKGCIAAGTSCARCPTAASRAFASSCCSPTARPTACRATTTRRRDWDVRCEPTTSRRTLPDPDGQTHDDPHIDGLYDNSATGAASPAVAPRCRRTGTTRAPSRRRTELHRIGAVSAADELAREPSQLRASRRRFRCRPTR